MNACVRQVIKYLLLAVVLKSVQRHVTATHFRGVHLWWDGLEGDNEANIIFRVAWRRDYRGQVTYCDDDIIRKGTPIGPPGAGYILCTEGCEHPETSIGNLLARCTDYSVSEEWSVGIGNHTYSFPDSGPFVLRWQGTGWLAGVHFASDAPWSARMVVDLTPRSDTGRVNSSPRSAVPPVIRLQHGCNHTITLPVTDPDSDDVRCRWASGEANECGGICGPFDGAVLDSETCTFRYMADEQYGYFAVAIQIEDFMREGALSLDPLSTVPLQFLLFIYAPASATSCDARPEFVPPTPDSCVYILPDDVYTVQIVVRMKDELVQLQEIQTISNVGMFKTEIFDYGSNPRDHAVNVTWVPTQAQSGETIFCFTALEVGGIASEQRCLFLFIGETSEPTVTLMQFNRTERRVVLSFNQPIKRSLVAKDIYVFSTTSGQALLSYDASKPSEVDVSDVTVSFVLPEEYTQRDHLLYLRLEQGVVSSAGSTQCGKQSAAVTAPTALKFSTFDTSSTPVPSTPTTTPQSTAPEVTSSEVTTFVPTVPATTSSDITDSVTIDDNTPAAARGGEKKNFTWLIVVIVCLLLVFALVTIVAVFVQRRRKAKEVYSREERQEEYARSVASKLATTNGAYTPDFNDIDVKFR